MNQNSFPNLARGFDIKDQAIIDEVNAVITQELTDAGIKPFDLEFQIKGEVPTTIVGFCSMWKFTRNWYYWVASGPGIPLDVANKLHEEYGTEVRVNGSCACPTPIEEFHGFGVGSYHVDTPNGLKALVETIKSVDVRNK